jgi:nicotinamide mononucleotide transporter
MQAVLDFLYTTIFTIGGTPTTLVEILGFITGALCVYLVAKANIWTFPIGIANALFFFVLFLEARLYFDMWLQVFFAAIQVFGWWAWLKAGPNRTALKINPTPKWAIIASLVGIVIFTYLLAPVSREAHGAYPIPDAMTTGLSVAAQILLSFKLIENWYLWIIADLIYIPVYFMKDLYFTSILYVVFLTLCVFGLKHWREVARGDRQMMGPNSSHSAKVAADIEPPPHRITAVS